MNSQNVKRKDEAKRLANFNASPPDCYVVREFEKTDSHPDGIYIEHPTCGVTVEKDGEIAAYVGLHYYYGDHWVFLNIRDDNLRNYPMWIHRNVKAVIDTLPKQGIKEVFAFCDTREFNAAKWLAALGFKKMQFNEKSVAQMAVEKIIATETGCKQWTWRRVWQD